MGSFGLCSTDYWWLRSPRNNTNNAGIVNRTDGSFNNDNVNNTNNGVRPDLPFLSETTLNVEKSERKVKECISILVDIRIN